MLYSSVIRPYLFRNDPEVAHEWAIDWMERVSAIPPVLKLMEALYTVKDPVTVAGIEFPNRVGLAAGMDKDGRCAPGFTALGFGHVEVGTVTPDGQPGNPKPRMFRFPEEQGLINRMGFNNKGAAAMRHRLEKNFSRATRRGILGVNLGKAKVTPLDQATQDYVKGIEALGPLADYITINISSPNTQGLRDLQGASYLNDLLGPIVGSRTQVSETIERALPIFLKIAPDITEEELDVILDALQQHGFDGIIATNTTLARPGPFSRVDEAGGLSGKPLTDRATEIISIIAQKTKGQLPIIGVGGIMTPEDALEKIKAGASLIQLYTGFVYGGPDFPKQVAKYIAQNT
ncbi:MAG: quinone-dependent dihydroorotate dehydrogenase [Opitutales bacterium]|nr:quinone-dependent dihydroorotate dehydrogenase [Opitutales bacterium]NRA25936.1 quinone-dependent dihydroorotate dehydrogenase [Opitutales bacterium]